MLRTTIVKNELSRAWVLIATLFVSLPCFGQDDSNLDSNTKSTGGVFERFFGLSPSKAEKPKPKVPASPTAGKPARSGFMVPLKSLTRAFRGTTETEMVEERDEVIPARMAQSRTPREPFRNLPRVQERIERDTVDLRVQQIAPNSLASPSIRSTLESKPLPIVRPESMKESTAAPKNVYAKSTNSKQVVAGGSKTNAPEIIIESNSTSRRTAMDSNNVESSTPARLASPTRMEPKPSDSNSRAAKQTELKSLVDLGLPPEKPKASLVTSSANNNLTSPLNPKSDGLGQTPSSDVPKISRSSTGNTAKLESKDRTPISNSPPKVSAAIALSQLHRESSVPGVRVTVNGPSSILVDDQGSYEVLVKNEGTETLDGLIVRVAVPTHVAIGDVLVSEGAAHANDDQDGNTIIWELGEILAGSIKTATLMLKTPKAEHFALGIEWTLLPQNEELKIEVQQPQLAIALEGPSEVIFGKPQMYRILVRNPGNADVRAVSISMTVEPYGSNQSEIGDVSAGSEKIVDVELTFQQSGKLPIVATATSAISKLEVRSAIDVQVRQSELVATWFGPTEFYQGSVTDYELEITNIGSIPAIGTNCTIKLPTGADVVSMPQGASRIGDIIKWEVKKIEPQEKLTVPLRLTLSRIGDNQLVFNGVCSSSAEVKSEFKTNIDAIADLHLTVVDPIAPAPVGQPVVYEVVIANRGKKVATDIEVIAQFSDGIEPIRVDGHTGRIVPGQAIFNLIPSIAANDKLVLRIHAEASKPGVHRFRVEVKSKGSDTDLLEEESTRYLATNIKGDRR